jgi:hypothetical protein
VAGIAIDARTDPELPDGWQMLQLDLDRFDLA